ncbi:hypothetical protein ECC02_006509 [Trypanosoma cruzi]|uniref:Uncharacterized protein n=1 Tax=Trypanosoma cruzi TaxID=5693 RepID=A0A7J6Y112_TRYCR|nr:hypothetical protein ECC02_006509 [Trypanosoma cruzi]
MRRLSRMKGFLSPTLFVRHGSSSWWLSRLLYGANASPLLGEWDTANSKEKGKLDDAVRVLYCKALVHASGGGRLARDWVAGCSAVVGASEKLLGIALKHDGTEQDVERYRDYLLTTLCKRMQEASNDGNGTVSSSMNSSSGGKGKVSASSEAGSLDAKELGNLPEVRCFVYDAMRAASFHRYHKVPEEDRQRLYAVAERLGVEEEVTRGIWQLVEKEGAVQREKQRALDYPWSD